MSNRRFWILLFALALALFAGLALMLRQQTIEAMRLAAEPLEDASPDAPALAQTLRTLKLITVEIHTTVGTESGDASWRGDVLASVRAPVTLYYGVDLAGLSSDDLRRNPLTGGWTIRVPAPRRLATEVHGGHEQPQVKVSGLRLRDVAGEYHLGLARVRLHERAGAMTLSFDDRQRLQRTTQEQLAALVRLLSGTTADVDVEFVPGELRTDAPPGEASSGASP